MQHELTTIDVLAFDPGVHIGWAHLTIVNDRLRQFRSGGTFDSVEECFTKIALAKEYAHLVAVEMVSADGGWVHARGGALAECNAIGGKLLGYARGLNIKTLELSAFEWREQLIGKRNATDAMVKQMTHALIKGMPKVSNDHMRDACGVALAAALRLRAGRKVA